MSPHSACPLILGWIKMIRENMPWHGQACHQVLHMNVGKANPQALFYSTSFPCHPEHLDPSFHLKLNLLMCARFGRERGQRKTVRSLAFVVKFPPLLNGRPCAAAWGLFSVGTKRILSGSLGWMKPYCWWTQVVRTRLDCGGSATQRHSHGPRSWRVTLARTACSPAGLDTPTPRRSEESSHSVVVNPGRNLPLSLSLVDKPTELLGQAGQPAERGRKMKSGGKRVERWKRREDGTRERMDEDPFMLHSQRALKPLSVTTRPLSLASLCSRTPFETRMRERSPPILQR